MFGCSNEKIIPKYPSKGKKTTYLSRMTIFNKIFLTYCDAPEAWQLGLQDPATPAAEGMSFFHD